MQTLMLFHNVLFPRWLPPQLFLFLVFGTLWSLVLVGNYLIDSLVLTVALRCQRIENRDRVKDESLVYVWIIGFISDILGSLLILGLEHLTERIGMIVHTELFSDKTLISLPGVVLAAFFIYHLNRWFSFRDCRLEPVQTKKLCWALAIFTAPYTMLIPIPLFD